MSLSQTKRPLNIRTSQLCFVYTNDSQIHVISASYKCSTTWPLSFLTDFKERFIYFCIKTYINSEINDLWSINNTFDVFDRLLAVDCLLDSDDSFDFLYFTSTQSYK